LKKIEQYDTVVRLNRSVEMLEQLKKYVGARTDVLYHCIDIAPEQGNFDYSLEEWKNKGIKHVRIPYPPVNFHYMKNINVFQYKNKSKIMDNSIIDIDLYSRIKDECGNTSPNTGTIAIIDILNNSPKTLHISGLTFLKGEKLYVDGYRDMINSEDLVRKQNSKYKNHSIDLQVNFLKKELKNYDNITYDDEVKQIIL
jgi:hypothetical protein